MLRFFASALLACLIGCGTAYSARSHRFESRWTVAQETQRLAERMSRGGTQRLFVYPDSGTILTPWTLLELHGDCERVDTMTLADLHALDRFGASLRE